MVFALLTDENGVGKLFSMRNLVFKEDESVDSDSPRDLLNVYKLAKITAFAECVSELFENELDVDDKFSLLRHKFNEQKWMLKTTLCFHRNAFEMALRDNVNGWLLQLYQCRKVDQHYLNGIY